MRSSKFCLVMASLAAPVLSSLAPAGAQAGYVVTAYAPSVYDGNTSDLNAAVGIAKGYAIESFESTKLLPNLTYTIDGQTFTSLPQTFAISQKLGQQALWQNSAWDGSNILVANKNNTVQGPWKAITFNVLGGTASFGVGVSNVESGTDGILVNGTLVGTFAGLGAQFQAGAGRNVYVRIDAGPGDAPITSVGFTVANSSEKVSFDQVAIEQHAPEPSTLVLAGLSALGLLGYGWRRRVLRPA